MVLFNSGEANTLAGRSRSCVPEIARRYLEKVLVGRHHFASGDTGDWFGGVLVRSSYSLDPRSGGKRAEGSSPVYRMGERVPP